MVEKNKFKNIFFLQDLPDNVLEKAAVSATVENYEKNAVLFHQDQPQKLLYMLVSGRVFFKRRSGAHSSVILDEITQGRTFGISVFLDKDSTADFTAECAEPSQIITIPAENMLSLCENDLNTGLNLMQRAVEIFKSRLEMHTRQFMHCLESHPEISAL